jgi:citrate synthase
MDGMLDTTEAAKRLGVKVPTLYAYVSRGLIQSHLGSDGRRSFFALEDVEGLARRSREARTVETRLATISTSITEITDDGPLYRGIPAISMLGRSFEDVADLLLAAEPGSWEPYPVIPPVGLELRDLVRCVVAMAGSFDSLRSDRRPEAVIAATRRLIATIVNSFPARRERTSTARGSIAEQLARKLSPDGRGTKWVDAVNATLVLLADNEIATSTLGVRLAASVRSDLYDATLAGLGIVGGPLHGGHSELVFDLLQRATEVGVERAVDEQLRWRSTLPGFGVRVYPAGDPRFRALKPLLTELLTDKKAEVFNSLIELASSRDLPQPNIDMAVATLVWSMDAEASLGPLIFSVGRLPGWASHYLEELGERPLRFRSRAIYVTSTSTMERAPAV